jgi:hypothetical protein
VEENFRFQNRPAFPDKWDQSDEFLTEIFDEKVGKENSVAKLQLAASWEILQRRKSIQIILGKMQSD